MRAKGVAEGMREALAGLLSREVKDPRAAGAVVTRVEMTGDLRAAKGWVRLLDASGDRGDRAGPSGAGHRRKEMVDALTRAPATLRREVTPRPLLRPPPTI